MNYDHNDTPDDAHSKEVKRVFETAYSLVPAATAFGRRFQFDPDTSYDLVMKAAERVIELRVREPAMAEDKIKNLPAYLFVVVRNLMFQELRLRSEETRIEELEAASETHIASATRQALMTDPRASLEMSIMLSELVRRMSPRAREIYNYRTQSFTYEEIADKFADMGHKTTAASLRSELSKAMARVSKELGIARSLG